MKAFVTAGGVSVAVNAAVYAAGRAAGVDFVVTSGAEELTVPYGQIALMSFVPVVVGGFVLRIAWRRARLVEAVAVIVTVLSLGGPLTMASDAGTGLTLAAMHLVVAAAFLVAAEQAGGRRALSGRRVRPSQIAAT